MEAMTGPHFSQDDEVIAQDNGFTGDFLDEWNNSVYCQVQKISCRFKEQAIIRHSCEECGLEKPQIETAMNYRLHTQAITNPCWYRTVSRLVLLIVVLYVHTAQASPFVTITSFKSPVWVQQGSIKSKLKQGDQWGIGDQINTGDSGEVELQLGAGFFLQVREDSELTYLAGNNTKTSPQGYLAKLSVSKGMVCIHSNSLLDTDSKLVFDMGNTLQAILQHTFDVCLKRTNGNSSVSLLSGSIQIIHYLSRHKIVLSQAGTEFRADGEGEYQFLTFSVGGDAIVENDDPPVSEGIAVEEIQSEEMSISLETENKNTVSDNDLELDDQDESTSSNNEKEEKPVSVEVDSDTLKIRPEFVYTIYLFSTRSEEVAEKTNRKFHHAGYKTNIYKHQVDEVTHYRIVLPGFESRQAAENFSQSIVGQYGIGDTWIGKNKSEH